MTNSTNSDDCFAESVIRCIEKGEGLVVPTIMEENDGIYWFEPVVYFVLTVAL